MPQVSEARARRSVSLPAPPFPSPGKAGRNSGPASRCLAVASSMQRRMLERNAPIENLCALAWHSRQLTRWAAASNRPTAETIASGVCSSKNTPVGVLIPIPAQCFGTPAAQSDKGRSACLCLCEGDSEILDAGVDERSGPPHVLTDDIGGLLTEDGHVPRRHPAYLPGFRSVTDNHETPFRHAGERPYDEIDTLVGHLPCRHEIIILALPARGEPFCVNRRPDDCCEAPVCLRDSPCHEVGIGDEAIDAVRGRDVPLAEAVQGRARQPALWAVFQPSSAQVPP